MIDAIRSEWIKLKTVPSTWVLTIIALLFPVIVTVITMLVSSDSSIRTTSAGDMVELVVGLAIVTALLVGTTIATATTTEFGNNTIRPTFVGLPDRWRTLIAKFIVYTVFAAVCMVVAVALAWFVGSILVNSRDGSIPMDEADTGIPTLIGACLLGVLLALLGYALGLLMRNAALAICTLLLWPLLVEGIVGALLNNISEGADKFLPYREGFQLVALNPEDNMFSRIGGGLYFAAWVLGLLALGFLVTHKRDA